MSAAFRPRVFHLVDDTTAGGVMRVIEHVTTSAALAETAAHSMITVPRGRVSLRKLRADIIVSHLSISWRTLPSLLALRARHPGTRIFHVEHSYTEGFVQHNVSNPRRFHALLRIGFALFDRVIAVSAAQAHWIRAKGLAPQDKCALIRSYTDLAPFAELPDREGPVRRYAAIGRLHRQKGFDRLIDAFRSTADPDLRLTIVGTGAEEADLRARAGGDHRIKFAGFALSSRGILQETDAVIMPSRWEAYGLVAVEALCAGRKLVCCDVDGLRDHARYGARLVASDHLQAAFENPVAEPCAMSGQDQRRRIVAILAAENIAGWKGICT